MADDIEKWLHFGLKGLIVAVATPFISGFLGGLASVLSKGWFAVGTTQVSLGLVAGAGLAYFVAEMVGSAIKS